MNSRQKGKRGELEFVHYLKAKGIQARRGQQYQGSSDSPDVLAEGCLSKVHFEVKRTERTDMYAWLEQARADTRLGSRISRDKLPIVAHRKNDQTWVAILDMDLFIDLMEKLDAQRPE